MLTGNRRKYLKNRNLDKGKKAEYDYRVLKWLEAMLDPGEEGGIGDINRVLDTLDREAIHKHLKDENVDNLLNLVERLLDILDFVPVGSIQSDQEVDFQGVKTKPIRHYVSKSILVASKDGGSVQELGSTRSATNEDIKRHEMLKRHLDLMKYFIEPGSHLPDYRSAEYFKDQINDAHEQGLIALAYDRRQSTKEEPQ